MVIVARVHVESTKSRNSKGNIGSSDYCQAPQQCPEQGKFRFAHRTDRASSQASTVKTSLYFAQPSPTYQNQLLYNWFNLPHFTGGRIDF
ncbi:hypothetical protein HZ326_24987 [Fusarium oxysporum f. sp. albedinis]|nr:hypothetical protein HZ326_24987 [Fusarium oxysporum f. sp. albedinis]